jgi:hypothetical protein
LRIIGVVAMATPTPILAKMKTSKPDRNFRLVGRRC